MLPAPDAVDGRRGLLWTLEVDVRQSAPALPCAGIPRHHFQRMCRSESIPRDTLATGVWGKIGPAGYPGACQWGKIGRSGSPAAASSVENGWSTVERAVFEAGKPGQALPSAHRRTVERASMVLDAAANRERHTR